MLAAILHLPRPADNRVWEWDYYRRIKVKRIPGGNHITRLLDDIDPGDFAEAFNRGLETNVELLRR
jgi:hypothetical protein